MIVWILGTPLQWFGNMEIQDLGHFFAYSILKEGVGILLIKIYVFVDIIWHLYK